VRVSVGFGVWFGTSTFGGNIVGYRMTSAAAE
jgi:hypothetical protein